MDIMQGLLDEIRKIVAEELDKRAQKPPEPLPDNTTFTPAEAAEYLGVSTQFVYRHSREGDLPSVKFGSRTILNKRDLDAWKAAGGTGQ